ncbi:hypothetical protein [Nitrosospira briensis]|uniref:hypothetical protein n=1 Tax=Nitrosospira briensis TaxID=35799 RepID=UPI00069E7029|nr:hypothetical protein [Nitrosospira briensis]
MNKLTFSHPVTTTRFPARLALATCTYVFAMLGGLGNAFSAPNDIAGDPKKALTVTEQYNLPIAEVSGLAIVRSIKDEKKGMDGDSVNLYAIGDKRYEVANFRTNGISNAIMDVHDAAPVIGKDKKDASSGKPSRRTEKIQSAC